MSNNDAESSSQPLINTEYCLICYDELDDQSVETLICGHLLCNECYCAFQESERFERVSKCPYCIIGAPPPNVALEQAIDKLMQKELAKLRRKDKVRELKRKVAQFFHLRASSSNDSG